MHGEDVNKRQPLIVFMLVEYIEILKSWNMFFMLMYDSIDGFWEDKSIIMDHDKGGKNALESTLSHVRPFCWAFYRKENIHKNSHSAKKVFDEIIKHLTEKEYIYALSELSPKEKEHAMSVTDAEQIPFIGKGLNDKSSSPGTQVMNNENDDILNKGMYSASISIIEEDQTRHLNTMKIAQSWKSSSLAPHIRKSVRNEDLNSKTCDCGKW